MTKTSSNVILIYTIICNRRKIATTMRINFAYMMIFITILPKQKEVALRIQLTISKFNCKIGIFRSISKKSIRIFIFRYIAFSQKLHAKAFSVEPVKFQTYKNVYIKNMSEKYQFKNQSRRIIYILYSLVQICNTVNNM